MCTNMLLFNQLERFKSVHDDSGHELTHNFRSTKPLNSRSLILVEGNEGYENFAMSSKMISVPLMFITTMIPFILGSKV